MILSHVLSKCAEIVYGLNSEIPELIHLKKNNTNYCMHFFVNILQTMSIYVVPEKGSYI